MCRATVWHVDFLLRYCVAIGSLAPASFWDASEDDLKRVHRVYPTFMLRRFSASALVLDWEYAQPSKSFFKFTAANYRLAVNVAKKPLTITICCPFSSGFRLGFCTKSSAGRFTRKERSMAQTQFEKEVIERLTAIEVKLGQDYKALHGNGKEGLIDRVNRLENTMSAGGIMYRAIVGFIAWIITLAVAVYAAIKN